MPRRELATSRTSWLTELRQQREQSEAKLVKAMALDSVPINPHRLVREIRDTIGARLQPRLSDDQSLYVAGCTAGHRDISLSF